MFLAGTNKQRSLETDRVARVNIMNVRLNKGNTNLHGPKNLLDSFSKNLEFHELGRKEENPWFLLYFYCPSVSHPPSRKWSGFLALKKKPTRTRPRFLLLLPLATNGTIRVEGELPRLKKGLISLHQPICGIKEPKVALYTVYYCTYFVYALIANFRN
jgi:hypothetical protein